MDEARLVAIEAMVAKMKTSDYAEEAIDLGYQIAYQHVPALVAEVRRLREHQGKVIPDD